MTPLVERDGACSTPRRRFTAPLLAGLLLSACHRIPIPVVAPPPPSAVRLAQLHHTIDGLLSGPAVERGTWGLLVTSVDRHDTLYSLGDRKLMMPASALKIVTLAVGAERLGWNHTYPTGVFTVGNVTDGVLDGHLLIVGSGDPTLDDWDGAASRLFGQWADILKAAGIHSISGSVIGDDNAFDDEGPGTGWAWDDLWASYATSVGALQFNENTAQLLITPASAAGDPPIVDIAPAWAPLSIRNRATTQPVNSGGPLPGPDSLRVRPTPRSGVLDLLGVAPLALPTVRNVAVPNATLYFVNALRSALIRNGIDVRGPAEDIDDTHVSVDRTRAVLLTHRESPPLREMAQTMMKMSQNLFAETLLKTMSDQEQPASWSRGLESVGRTLALWEIPEGDIRMVDGSGLSRYNLITPHALEAVLSHVYRDERLRGPFLEALPVAAVDGTLSGRMRGTAASGNARAKTGSFSNARCLAGYVTTADGETVVFVIMANNYGLAPVVVDQITDHIVVALAEFSRR